ncbi:MAG: methyltransferase [Alphaproteobacteria bacterium]|nr:methyltransferase [Alphaproteobacteria bacterium]
MTWRHLHVSADRTHHVQPDGTPAYAPRFAEVLAFHAPGLAPAVDDHGATHIHPDGSPAYDQRHQRTFGFYEGLAAVDTGTGWHHIRPDGTPASPRRFAWCGNYQARRCAVRADDGRYHHLRADGTDAYPQRWRYVGDYRDGIAVVQRDDGLHTHVDVDGGPLHARWFVDLDVFHKGYARARDAAGWTHVDRQGRPIYEARFAAVEPFYNGQARVERPDGGLEVIDEAGRTLVELRPARRSAFAELSGDLVGFWRTDAVANAVSLGVVDRLPGSAEALGAELGLVPDRLLTLLRGLRELGLVRRDGRRWAQTDKGGFLRSDHPWTLADAALEYAGPLRALWADLPTALKDSGWRPPDVFGDVAADASRVVPHHRMLRSYARHDYRSVPEALRLRGDETVLDVGGGLGVLAALLVARHPDLTVHVLDRPEVVAQLASIDRVHACATDLFSSLPNRGDAAILARVLHDWDDPDAVRILSNVRAALPRGGRLFVVEMLLSDDGAFGGLCDLHLLMATGGRERTESAYRSLFETAGFDVTAVHTLAALPSVIEGVAR